LEDAALHADYGCGLKFGFVGGVRRGQQGDGHDREQHESAFHISSFAPQDQLLSGAHDG